MSVDWIFFKFQKRKEAPINSGEIIETFHLNIDKSCQLKETIYKYHTFLDFSNDYGFVINRPYQKELLPCIYNFLRIKGHIMHDTDGFHIANLETLKEIDEEININEVTYASSLDEFYQNISFNPTLQ